MLTFFLSAAAFGTTSAISVYGTSYSGAYDHTGGVASAIAPAMGITSLTVAEYQFTDTVWTNVATKIGQNIGAPPTGGTLVWAAFYTNDASPGTSLSLTNVAGADYVYRLTNGELDHRMYFRNSGGTAYTEDVGFRDVVVGGLPCEQLSALEAVTYGGLSANSTVYVLSSDSTASYATGTKIDLNVLTYTLYTYPWVTPATVVYVRTQPSDDATFDDPYTSGDVGLCRGGVFGGSCTVDGDTQCDAFTKKCAVTEPTGSVCVTSAIAADQTYNVNLVLLHDFRDRLWDYSGLHKYVTAYVLYSMYESLSNVTAVVQALPGIEQAAYVVLHGGPNQVVLGNPLKIKMTAIITHATGKNAYLDILLADLQTKINATVGLTRSQFCSYMVSDSDCTP